MEQARVQEETQMKMDHARRLKQMRQSLEDEKKKRSEESARLRRQLELKQATPLLPGLFHGTVCLGPMCDKSLEFFFFFCKGKVYKWNCLATRFFVK